jgi:hypothetical protein
MKTTRKHQRRVRPQARRGKVAVDVVASLSVFFTIAMALFVLCALACNRLHHVISILVGYPYS